MVIINDDSPDNTHKLSDVFLEKYPDKITYIKLAKNFGEYNAVMAGLRYAQGELIIIVDDDYQNLPQEVFKLAKFSLSNNYDAVFCKYKEKKHSFIRNIMSKINNFSAEYLLKKPKNIYFSSFKSISRKLVDQIIKYNGPYPYIDGLILSNTKNFGSLEIEHSDRKHGKSNYNLYKLAKHYSNLITNFSTIPIHLFSILGLIVTTISIFLIFYILVEKYLNPDIPLGYASLITIILFFSGIQILFLGLIGEYIGKILKNVNKENQYVIDIIKKKIIKIYNKKFQINSKRLIF